MVPKQEEPTIINKIKKLFSEEVKLEEKFITKSIRRGLGKMGFKNNDPPFKIYFSPKLNRFISTPIQLSGHIPLKHFLNGTLTLPSCGGSPIKIHDRKGHFD